MPRKTEREPSEAGSARRRENTPPSADLCEAEGEAARGILEPDRLRENLESLKMKNTLEILDKEPRLDLVAPGLVVCGYFHKWEGRPVVGIHVDQADFHISTPKMSQTLRSPM